MEYNEFRDKEKINELLLKYDFAKELIEEVYSCSQIINDLDIKMEKIRKKLI